MSELAKASKNDGQDDGLSITSTSEENEDTDEFFSFDRILAERQVGTKLMYLVEWENYPLARATWEPLKHFEHGTFVKWEEFKKESGRRTAPGFKISDWKKALHEEIAMKRARHEARNAKRLSSGRQDTTFRNSREVYLGIIEGSLEDFEEPLDETIVVQGVTSADDTSAHKPRESGHTCVSPGAETRLKNQSRAPGSKLPAPRPPVSGEEVPVAQKSPVNQQRRLSFKREKPNSLPSLVAATRQPKPLTLARTTAGARSSQPAPVSSDASVGANVFVGGKTSKDRRTILDAVSDTSKEPKMLRFRHQNIVRKRLRDREGLVEPAFPPTRLVALRGSPSSLVRSGSTIEPDMGTAATADDVSWDRHESPDLEMAPDLPHNSNSPDAVPSQLGAGSLGPSENQTGENMRKRKRSVRWDDTVTVMEAPDAREEASRSPLAAPESMQSGYSSQDLESKPISILCQFGASEADQLIMTFYGLPGHLNLPWLQHFSNQVLMVFTHSCTAQDFSTQTELPDKQLCRGLISSAPGDERFEIIARRLRSSCLGLLCHNGEYCVLVFASEDEGVTAEHGTDLDVSSSCLLKYSIIRPSTFLEPPMLASLTCADSRVGPDTGPMQDVPVFDMFFEFEYDQLLPPSARREDRHNYFLAFPPSARQETQFISQWLRYFDTDCDIRTSLHPGSWSGFLKLGQGTLILHEDALWAVRLFPNLATLLRAPTGAYSFFLFKKAEPLLQMPPSRDLSSLGGGGGGRTQLCPILRPGTAFLVTPSFLASQPEQAYIFVKWFWQNYSRSSQTYRRGKLVVCSDIEDWTLNLAVQRRGSDEELQRHGASPKWAEMRFKMLCLLRTLVADSTEETDGHVVFAPDIINGSDEQSLVNWFGSWAIMNIGQLRKFSVIGSGNQHPDRLALCIRLPNYHKAATAEPQQPASENHTDFAAHQSHGAAWQLVYNDGAAALASHISQVEEALHQEAFRPMSLYRYPVSYWNPDMAYHFTDYKSEYKTFREWLHLFPEFVNVGGRKRGGRGIYNSYAGLFYTIEDAFDRTKYPQGVKPTRRPWVAILRPTNPHRRPWSTGELFIWDCTAWAQYPGDSAVHLNDLICAQRELVKVIQEESQSTFELPLQRVWLGGATADCGGHRYSEPLDIALSWLANLPQNIKNLVPAPCNKIPERNWKEVLPGHGPGRPAESTAAIPLDGDLPESEVTGPKSMIFRAPRVDGEAWRPECRNLLHDWAERTRRVNKSVVRAEYSFEPTMRWYNEQVQKGQGLCHLDVSPWKAIFTRLKIPDPKDVSDQG